MLCIARGMPSQDFRPSVRLSVCLSVCQSVSKKLVSRFIDGATCSSEPIPIRRKFSPLVYCLHYYNSAATAAAKELILVACISLFVTLLPCRIARKTIRPTPIVMEQQVMGTRLGLYMLGQNCQNQHLWTWKPQGSQKQIMAIAIYIHKAVFLTKWL